MTVAWHTENFRRMGRKMRGLDHHLKALKPRPVQTPEQVVAIFESFAARGLATIRQVKKGGENGS